jgi:hypothetical protein
MRPPELVVPFLGAGVSESAGLSGSPRLASALLETFDGESGYQEPEPLLASVVDFLLQEAARSVVRG